MNVSTRSSLLLQQKDLLENQGHLPPWFVEAYKQFHAIVIDKEKQFPCYFAIDGERIRLNWYTYVDRRSPKASLSQLSETLGRFLDVSAQVSRKRVSLLAFFGPPQQEEVSLMQYRDQFWHVLASLRKHDPQPWPRTVPVDPRDPKWEFCFSGEPLFVFGNCPAYKLRRSRNVGDCLVIVFQPKRVFHGIGGETPAGRAAKARIRNRLQAYDLIPPHSDLGSYDHSSTSKWRQYFLPDDATAISDECPFTASAWT